MTLLQLVYIHNESIMTLSFLFERKPEINNGIPNKDGIKGVKLPLSLRKYDAIPENIRMLPHIIAKFGIDVPRNLNSLFMNGRTRQSLR